MPCVALADEQDMEEAADQIQQQPEGCFYHQRAIIPETKEDNLYQSFLAIYSQVPQLTSGSGNLTSPYQANLEV